MLWEFAIGDERVGVRAARKVQSPDADHIWFVAADVEGPGYEGPGPIQVWWVEDNLSGTVIVPGLTEEQNQILADGEFIDSMTPVNEAAKRFFPKDDHWWADEWDRLGDVPEGVRGAELAELCVAHALQENPDEITAGEFFRPGQWIGFGDGDSPVLIVELDPDSGTCGSLFFSRREGETAYSRTGWPDRVASSPFPVSLRMCEDKLRHEKTVAPSLNMESIPAVYRHIADPSLSPAPTPTPTPLPTATPVVDPVEYETCFEPAAELRDAILQRGARADIGLRGFQMVRVEGSTNMWMIAADVEGPGIGVEELYAVFGVNGVWQSDLISDRPKILNGVAESYTGSGIPIEEVSQNDRMYLPSTTLVNSLLRATICVREELEGNPETPVYYPDL